MSANDHNLLRLRVINSRLAYQKDGDSIRYFSNCTASALSLWIAEQNVLRARMGKLGHVAPAALSATSPLLMAALDLIADELHCPVDRQHTAFDFLEHFAERVQARYDTEYVGPMRNALKPVRDALQSLGLLS
jgi:hypothetical protein